MTKPDKPRSRRRRSLMWIVATLISMPLLVLVVAEVALQQTSVQQAIIGQLTKEVAARTGLRLDSESREGRLRADPDLVE